MHEFEPMEEIRAPEMDFDVVDEASAESFPASDPPIWATGQRRGASPRDAVQSGGLSQDRVIDIAPGRRVPSEDRPPDG